VEYPTRHLYFLSLDTSLLGECVYQENTRDKCNVPWYSTRERCVTILYHAIENTVDNTINVIYARSMTGKLDVIPSNIQRLSCILIGCIFYGMDLI